MLLHIYHMPLNLSHLLTAGTLPHLPYLPDRKTVIHLLFNNEVVYWN